MCPNFRTIRGDLAAAARLPKLPRPPEPRLLSVRSLRHVSAGARLVRLLDAARAEAFSDEKAVQPEVVVSEQLTGWPEVDGADEGSRRP